MRARYVVLPLLATLPNFLGCYAYLPVTTLPSTGAAVDVLLSDAGTVAVTSTLGPNAARILGDLAAVRGDTLAIRISEVHLRDGQALFLHGTTVSLARSDAAQVRVRTLDRRRTVVASAIGIFGAAALIAGIRFAADGFGTDGGGGGTPAMTPP